MTTLGIIGGGIAGRSFLYRLAKESHSFSKILFFSSEDFAHACSLQSTAIVAARGITSGHSPLGDLLSKSFLTFKQHVSADAPAGVEALPQFTGALTKLETFKIRYPGGAEQRELLSIPFRKSLYLAQEEAFHIHPSTYLEWLLVEAKKKLPLEHINSFVEDVTVGNKVSIKTHHGHEFQVDRLIMAGGSSNRFWKSLFKDSKLDSSKPVQGTYLEFAGDLNLPSFSLTLEGDNLIYSQESHTLLMGSTTQDSFHELAPRVELEAIYARLQTALDWTLPPLSRAQVRVGLREKASKREPYLIHTPQLLAVGGFYKNGYSLSLEMAGKIISEWV